MFALVSSARINHAARFASRRRRFGLMARLAACCVLGTVAAVGLTGCGGDDNTGTIATAPSGFAGQYSSTVALSGGQTGDTRITVSSNGSASGTLTVNGTASALRAVHTRAVLATYNLTGSVNLSTGQYSLTGTGGPTGFPSTINLTGALPINGSGGTLSLVFGEQTFTSTLTVVSTTGGGRTTRSSTTTNVTFSNPSGTNADTSGFSGVTVATVVGAAGFSVTNITATNGSRILSVNLNGAITAGQTLTAGDDATVQYVEGSGTSARTWLASSGSVVIDSISGSTVTYHVTNADLSPLGGATGGGNATGTFRINASGTYVTQ